MRTGGIFNKSIAIADAFQKTLAQIVSAAAIRESKSRADSREPCLGGSRCS
jgi:hypothetical protein